MDLSEKIKSVPPSPTLAVVGKAAELRAKGVDVISFGVGEPDFPTPEHIRKAGIEAIEKGYTRYTAGDGIPELKEAIIQKLERDNGLSYTPAQIAVNCGGKHSLYLVLVSLLNPGDEVIVPSPYWVSYPPMVLLADGKPVIVTTREEDDFKLKPEDLKAAITDRTKAIFINSPSNPTGSAYTADELRPLAEICAEKGVLMLSDEIYEKILFDGLKFTATASLSKEIYENTVTLNGVSKAYAMTGWRIGYMAGPEPLVRAAAKVQGQSTSCPCSISQRAAVAALAGPQDDVAMMLEAFEARRDYIMKRQAEIPGCKCPRPSGAFYTFPNLSAYYGKSYGDKTIENSVDLAAYILEEAQVAAVPGVAFGEDLCIRFSYATSMELIEKGMDQIQDALSKLS